MIIMKLDHHQTSLNNHLCHLTYYVHQQEQEQKQKHYDDILLQKEKLKQINDTFKSSSKFLFYIFNLYLLLIFSLSLIKLVKIFNIFSTILFLILIVSFSSYLINTNKNRKYKLSSKNLYNLNLNLFNRLILPNSLNLYNFLILIKYYVLFNVKILFIFTYKNQIRSKLKVFFILSLFLTPNSIVNGQSEKNIKTDTDCPDDVYEQNYTIEYDENLFNQLNMHETLLNLYRSCLKDKYYDYKSSFTTHKTSSNTGSKANTCKKKKIDIKHILTGLWFNKEKYFLDKDVLERIELVCSNNKIDQIDKIYLLSDYKHDICGNVFRNSIKQSNMIKYILNEEQNEKEVSSHNNIKNHHRHKHHSYLHSNLIKFKKHLNNNQQIITSISSDSLYFNNITAEYRSNSTLFSATTTNTNSYINMTISDLSEFVQPIKKTLNNCTLILLNTYLLAYKASCDYDDFVVSLNHFDCAGSNFSVKSNCNKCQDAYKKWLCSSIIPYYYENDKLAKPCQRYCYSVQNLCPFFRPVDNYGGQPVFHCRNVIQVTESNPDGYEDDDENYYDDDKHDDDRCYGECMNNLNGTKLKVDLNIIFKEKFIYLTDSNTSIIQEASYDSLIDTWLEKRSYLTTSKNDQIEKFLRFENKQINSSFNSFGRFNNIDECLFNLSPGLSSSGFTSTIKQTTRTKYTNLILFIFFIKFKFTFLFNEI